MNTNEAFELQKLRAKLVGEEIPTVAVAYLTRTDGAVVVLEHVNVDSIGPSAANPGVVSVEFENDTWRIVHLPFIESWEIEYR